MPTRQFPKAVRLLNAREFETVFAARLSASDTWVVVYGIANDMNHPRLGLMVSRRIGGAVVRNRWKRLLREAFRRKQHELPAFDLVCMPRSATPPPLTQLLTSLTSLANRIRQQLEHRQRRDGGRPV